jgi:hypothetical protein
MVSGNPGIVSRDAGTYIYEIKETDVDDWQVEYLVLEKDGPGSTGDGPNDDDIVCWSDTELRHDC